MKELPVYTTIDGQKGRIFPAAMVTVGRKDLRRDARGNWLSKGNPTDKDGFFVMNYLTSIDDPNGKRAREQHPAFAAWNAKPAAERRIIKGVLLRDEVDKVIQRELNAWADPQGKVAGGHHGWCYGNGIEAQRWKNGEYQTIRCPNELCEFRQGDKPVCKEHTRLQFMLRLDGCPNVLCEWDSKSAQSGAAALGLFEFVQQVHKELNIQPHYFGLPFTIQLTEKTNPEKRRRYPIVTFTVDGSPVEATQAKLQAAHQGAMLLPAPVQPSVTPINEGPADAEEATREMLQPGAYAPANERSKPAEVVPAETPIEVAVLEEQKPAEAAPPAPDAPITSAQFDKLYGEWKRQGGDNAGWKKWLANHGIKRGSEITQAQYAGLWKEAAGL